MNQIRRLLRRRQVVEATGRAATTIYYLEKRGEFPAHWMQSPRCAVWDAAEVEAWIVNQRSKGITPAPVPNMKDPAVKAKSVNTRMVNAAARKAAARAAS